MPPLCYRPSHCLLLCRHRATTLTLRPTTQPRLCCCPLRWHNHAAACNVATVLPHVVLPSIAAHRATYRVAITVVCCAAVRCRPSCRRGHAMAALLAVVLAHYSGVEGDSTGLWNLHTERDERKKRNKGQ